MRLEALSQEPIAFRASYEEESKWSDQAFQEYLAHTTVFGAFVDGILAASIGFYKLSGLKVQHRGVIGSMYVSPPYRGRGIADQLMLSIISYAKSQVMQLHLACVTTNEAALRLYRRHGFKVYGTELRAFKIDHQFYDEHLMMLCLNN